MLAEHRLGQLQDISFELLSEGRKIADRLGEQLCAVLLGHEVEHLAPVLGQHGANTIYVARCEALHCYSIATYTAILADMIGRYAPSVFFIGATSTGKDLAPRLATRVKTGLIADAIILKVDASKRLLVTRPVYGEKLYGTVASAAGRLQMITVRPGAMDVEDPDPTRKAEIVSVEVKGDLGDPLSRVIDLIKADPRTIDLAEAQIVVAGGRGVNGKEGLLLLEELADALGASIGGTRAAVDAGLLPFEKQIGQTGKTVSPKVYIACGISGATQHTVGMKDSKMIIAINSDRNAPIFKVANQRIVGDLHVIVPAITNRLKESRSSALATSESGRK